MKIQYKVSKLVSVHNEAIIHGCNAQGVMGSGFAKFLRDLYPAIYDPYAHYCKYNEALGKIVPVHYHDFSIINAITQQLYGRNPDFRYVSYLAIRTCFAEANKLCHTHQYRKLNMPMIGAGLANGDWRIISRLIEEECTLVQPVVWVEDVQKMTKLMELMEWSVDDVNLIV